MPLFATCCYAATDILLLLPFSFHYADCYAIIAAFAAMLMILMIFCRCSFDYAAFRYLLPYAADDAAPSRLLFMLHWFRRFASSPFRFSAIRRYAIISPYV